MEKKQYIQPEVEFITPQYLMQPDGDLTHATPLSGEDYGGANSGNFDDEEDDNGFTPVATSLWD